MQRVSSADPTIVDVLYILYSLYYTCTDKVNGKKNRKEGRISLSRGVGDHVFCMAVNYLIVCIPYMPGYVEYVEYVEYV